MIDRSGAFPYVLGLAYDNEFMSPKSALRFWDNDMNRQKIDVSGLDKSPPRRMLRAAIRKAV